MTHNKTIIVIINTIIVIAISYFLVQLLWLYLGKNISNDNLSNIYNFNKQINKQTIKIKPIFGEIITQSINPLQKVKKVVPQKTKLNLKLKGIWLDDNNYQKSYVLINVSGKDKVYKLNDSISSLAIIKDIYKNYITINRSGTIESLYLRANNNKLLAIVSNTNTNNRSLKTNLSKNDMIELRKIHSQLKKNPWKLSQIMRINPYYKNGILQGFKIRPGREAVLFKKLGLQSGDVAYKINAKKLSFKNLTKVLSSVLNNNTIIIDIYRKQTPLSLTLKL